MRQPHRNDSIPLESNSTGVSLNIAHEITQPQDEVSNPPCSSLAELFYNTIRIVNKPAPIQPVRPVIGLTLEEQRRREEDLTSP